MTKKEAKLFIIKKLTILHHKILIFPTIIGLLYPPSTFRFINLFHNIILCCPIFIGILVIGSKQFLRLGHIKWLEGQAEAMLHHCDGRAENVGKHCNGHCIDVIIGQFRGLLCVFFVNGGCM